jgi:hypothetical protein
MWPLWKFLHRGTGGGKAHRPSEFRAWRERERAQQRGVGRAGSREQEQTESSRVQQSREQQQSAAECSRVPAECSIVQSREQRAAASSSEQRVAHARWRRRGFGFERSERWELGAGSLVGIFTKIAAAGSIPRSTFVGVFMYVPSPLCRARVTTAEADFLILDLRRYPRPTSDNRSTYTHQVQWAGPPGLWVSR